ncbi:MAG: M23 family metallopeptidase [Bacteroidia bacterium]|nr:M23 family metallopeptidase [Bacteroidia bacterium]NNJ54619.1 M23 family metallopeptidase [Bacteroidia bacterium]
MKRTNLYYILIIGGILSLFATCRNVIKEPGSEEDLSDSDTTEVDLKTPVVDLDPVPSKISYSSPGKYSFTRNTNPYTQNYFRKPFDSTIYVSGTFCELRGNHFHGGLDIRTGGQEGWKVLAAADGFVERVKVSTSGYGRVVYIRHPNGYTTVYGHLQKFKGALANYVKEAQYKQRKFEIELFPKAGEIKIKKSENFALSGNTGGSGGPHLHFEIRNPQGQSTNPLMHGIDVPDKLKPVIKNVSFYLKDKNVLHAEGNYPFKIVSRSSEYLKNTKAVNAKPGTYSFGLRTDDYFTDRRNRLGINYCWLTANGYLLYQYQIEKFAFNQGRYINTHTDPYLKFKKGHSYIRLFKEKFNPLKYYKQNQNGEVWLQQDDSVQMKLFIQDYAGLTDSVSWLMVGDSLGEKLTWKDNNDFEAIQRINAERGKTFKYDNWTISIPPKTIYHTIDFKLKEKPIKPKMLSKTLQMHYAYTPLHSYINVSYKVPAEFMKYGDKLCAVSFDGSRTYYEGGVLKGSNLSFRTRSLGEYAITYDNSPPVIKPISVGKKYRFRVSENLSGVDRIICSLDGKWILAEYEPKTGAIWGEIPNWIKPGTYEFKLIVIDSKNNRAEYKKSVSL